MGENSFGLIKLCLMLTQPLGLLALPALAQREAFDLARLRELGFFFGKMLLETLALFRLKAVA